MRGQILGVEAERGLLLGPADERRGFPLSEWRSGGAPQIGQWVDFVAEGDEARSIYAIPQAAAPGAPITPGARPTSGFVLGAIGLCCLAAGLIIPVVPTLGAFIFGIIGAARAQEERDQTGLTLSRISWIGALVLMGLGIVALIILLVFFSGLAGLIWHSGAVMAPPINT